MRTAMRWLTLATVGLMLSGCLAFGSVERRGTAIDEGVGSLQNRAILINLARASQGEPLYFMSIGNVTGQGLADLKLANPSFLEGPGMLHIDTLKQLTFSAGSDVLDNQAMTNFVMSQYASKDFYTGLMTPLGLNEVDILLHQGFPRELVYYLVIDHAKFIDATDPTNPAKSFFVYNDPSLEGGLTPPGPGAKPTFAQFQAVMQLAMSTGFTTEVTPAPDCGSDHSGPGCGGAQQPLLIGTAPAPAGGAGGVQFVLQQKAADKGASVRLCFERAMASPDKTFPVTGLELLTEAETELQKEVAAGTLSRERAESMKPIYCGLQGGRGGKQVVWLPAPINHFYEIQIYTRSIYGIFEYLGKLMDGPNSEVPTLKDFGVIGERTPEGPLLSLTKSAGGPCFTSTRYDGEFYCVPRSAEALNTRTIFNILNALVILKQSPGDLPVSQTVLVAP